VDYFCVRQLGGTLAGGQKVRLNFTGLDLPGRCASASLRPESGGVLQPQRRLGTKELFWKAKQDLASSFFQRAASLPLIYQAARGEWRDICRVG